MALTMTMSEKEQLALDLFIESLLEPDHKLRSQAKSEGCYDELMMWRRLVLNYCYHIHRGWRDEENHELTE